MSTPSNQQARAQQFHHLHDELLVLPNAWDPPSARMIERAGASAVATTSAGVAWSRGVADAGGLDRATALDAVARIVSSVSIPVTVDIEDGYVDGPGGVAATIDAVISAGAVGVNIEDSRAGRLLPVEAHADVLRTVTARLADSSVSLFVNARVDTFLLADGSESSPALLADTVERARAYVAADAHGVFVPGVTDPDTIRALAAGIDAPLNIMVGAGSRPVAELAALGARRISSGPQLAMSAYGQVQDWARVMVGGGSFDHLPVGASPAELHTGSPQSATTRA
ncbi:MAG: isocitrate lyase/phosphoenolpyruvate mutase family protein [Streptosporangiales bacterium]|nr:isocitrate lyase/phosphoenolpyruvate mutase family protein [Streptosporangiales bacterium]